VVVGKRQVDHQHLAWVAPSQLGAEVQRQRRPARPALGRVNRDLCRGGAGGDLVGPVEEGPKVAVALRIERDDLRYFSDWHMQDLLGKRVLARGWFAS